MRDNTLGLYSGFDIDIITEICKRLDYECQFKTHPFHELFPLLNKGELDLAISGILITPQRRKQVRFTIPYITSYFRMVGFSIPPDEALTQWAIDKRVGMLQDFLPLPQVKVLSAITQKMEGFTVIDDLIDALSKKDVEGVFIDDEQAHYWQATGGIDLKLSKSKIPVGEGYGIALAKQNRELAEKINQVLLSIEADGTYLRIYKRYFNPKAPITSLQSIHQPETPKKKPLEVGLVGYFPPYSENVSKKGGFSGFDIDIMTEICARIQRNCKFVEAPFEELLPNVSKGEIDLAISAILITEERSEDVTFSLPYLPSFLTFLASTSHTTPFVPDEFGDLSIGVLDRMVKIDQVKKLNARTKKMKTYTLIHNLVADLDDGEVDRALVDYHSAKYWVAAVDTSLKLIGIKHQVGSGYGIAINKDNRILKLAIDQAIIDMENDGTLKQLYNKYFSSVPPQE